MASKRFNRLLVIGVAFIGLVGLMMLSVAPEVQYTVDEIMADPDSHEGGIHVRGIVLNETLDEDSSSFRLTGLNHEIDVSFSAISLPDGFNEGHTIAVKGELIRTDSGWYIDANEIQTGCPSKYESQSNPSE